MDIDIGENFEPQGYTVVDNQSPLVCLMNYVGGGNGPNRFEVSKYSSLDVNDKIYMSQFAKIDKIRF